MTNHIEENRPVLELWWEENDLHIIYADNNDHVICKNAYFTNHQLDFENDTEIKIEVKELK